MKPFRRRVHQPARQEKLMEELEQALIDLGTSSDVASRVRQRFHAKLKGSWGFLPF